MSFFKLENNDLNDKVDVLSNPHILVKNIIQYSELCMYAPLLKWA